MSREKRKAADEWTEATLLQDADRRGVYLASFAGVIPPPTTTFREYKRKRKDRGDEKDVILQGETERIEFEGRTTSTDNDDTCQYAICIYNPEKESVKIVPAPMLHMQRSIKALKSRAEKADSDSSLKASFITIQDQRVALGQAFGSKRSKAAIASQLSGHIDSKALESVASQIYANVKAATDNIPSQSALLEEAAADRPIPDIDLSATAPAGLYSLDSVVTKSELSTIDAEAIFALPDETARLGAMPYKTSHFIRDRLTELFKKKTPDQARLRLLYYAALLMAFFKNHRLASKHAALKNVLGSVPNPLLNGLLSRYTESQVTSASGDAKKRLVCTNKCQDKVLCYLFVLCLLIDDFIVDINQLAHDLQIKPMRATELFKTVGCKITAITEAERERRKITKSEAKTYKLAKLVCPPEFPKPRKQAKSKRT